MELTKYDRPSLHSADPRTRTLGRVFALMDQHIDAVHPEYMAEHGSFDWHDFGCGLCEFNARDALHEMYPGEP